MTPKIQIVIIFLFEFQYSFDLWQKNMIPLKKKNVDLENFETYKKVDMPLLKSYNIYINFSLDT